MFSISRDRKMMEKWNENIIGSGGTRIIFEGRLKFFFRRVLNFFFVQLKNK